MSHTVCHRRACVSKILRNATSYNRAQLGVLEGCPLVLLGRVREGLAPSHTALSWEFPKHWLPPGEGGMQARTLTFAPFPQERLQEEQRLHQLKEQERERIHTIEIKKMTAIEVKIVCLIVLRNFGW